MLITGIMATEDCNKLNLFSILVSGIDGALHSTLSEYIKSQVSPVAD